MAGNSYTEKAIINRVKDIIAKTDNTENVNILYQHVVVNHIGQTSDSNRSYQEVVSEWLLDHLDVLDTIKPLHRKNYFFESHDGSFTETKDNKDSEEVVAYYMFNSKKTYSKIGKMIDYQVNLKRPKEDRNGEPKDSKVGKIDLVSYNEKDKQVYLLELKKKDNKSDTLLRAILEIYTYWKQLNHTNFRNSHKCISKTSPIIPAILIFKDSLQHEYCDETKYPKTNELMDKLGIPVFIAEETSPREYNITLLKR